MKHPQTILSLCDGLGSWSRPYVDNDYDVIRWDIKDGMDIRLAPRPDRPIHGILAAPPCTVFAASGARWKRTEGEMLQGLSVVDACLRVIYATKPAWWALENPSGTLIRYLGPWRTTFQPFHYGDPYTKRTCLWGDFTIPEIAPVEPYEGSKMHRYAPGADRATRRSITPGGFARAFFEANP